MVLVTGATGILGRVLVLELLKRGKTVRAAKRPSSDLAEVRRSYRFYSENPNEWFEKIIWQDIDLDDGTSLASALAGVEEVYHCAAKVSFDPADYKEIYNTNVLGTKNLLYACENSSVKKFCFVSSIAVLDGYNENAEMDEESYFNPKLDHSAYAKSKHFAEMEVWRAFAEGLDVVIVNPGMIIGSGNWEESSGAIFKNFADNPYTFSGAAAYVDVRDVAKLSVDLMEKNIFGQRFILTSEIKKYKELADAVRKRLGRSETKILPKYVLEAAKIISPAVGWLHPLLRLANKVNIEALTSESKVTSRKIQEILVADFIPVATSIDFHLKNYIQDLQSKL